MYKLNDKVTEISGIGPKYQAILEKVGITTIEDLITHYPFRYEDKSNKKNISEITESEFVQIKCEVVKIQNIYTRNRKKITKGLLKDSTGTLEVIWFNQHYIKQQLPEGAIIRFFGRVEVDGKKKILISPEILKSDIESDRFIPVYSTTNGITSNWFTKKIEEVLRGVEVEEYFTNTEINKYNITNRAKALNLIHKPKTPKDIETARKTLSFEEMLFLHLKGLYLKKEWTKLKTSAKIELVEKDKKLFINSLPFKLTNAQERSISEILQDLKSDIPMNRLLQGDVGSGKTVVTGMAIYANALSKHNSILIAPTQILAEQHFKTIKNLIPKTVATVVLETSNNSELEEVDTSKPLIIIGTHAILHRLDSIKEIGLVIIDEQHKFGVEQRSILINHFIKEIDGLEETPNVLTMTATPIPRSLALTFYGDLDLSVIDELPKNRKPVTTWVIKEKQKLNAYKWIENEIIKNKTQVFWVCPFIEKSEHEALKNVKAAEDEFLIIQEKLKNLKVKLLHGRMKADEKNKILTSFKNKEFDILVTTPVIEVGIDILNANIIFIETAERFGLASLHQLRGRVGRGGKEAYCIVAPSEYSKTSIERLKYLETINNGNKLAEIDLQLRGVGDIYGTKQHGYLDLKIADLTNIEQIKKTKEVAVNVLENIDSHLVIQKKLAQLVNIKNN